jgi:hypothetical protein
MMFSANAAVTQVGGTISISQPRDVMGVVDLDAVGALDVHGLSEARHCVAVMRPGCPSSGEVELMSA